MSLRRRQMIARQPFGRDTEGRLRRQHWNKYGPRALPEARRCEAPDSSGRCALGRGHAGPHFYVRWHT